jgi:hypothetical protein
MNELCVTLEMWMSTYQIGVKTIEMQQEQPNKMGGCQLC